MGAENIIIKKKLNSLSVVNHSIYSDYLEREVIVDIYFPQNTISVDNLSLLLINDGQDLHKMPFDELLDVLITAGSIEPLLCIGLYCSINRDQEYGTAYRVDYKGRGSRAGLYKKFIFDELLPFIKNTYQVKSFKEKSFAGFSLGGLSALDIVYNHPDDFNKAGVFSGSLWWRRKGYNEGYDEEKDRIMHLQIKKGIHHPMLKFFIQTGMLDETADRNNNGVIDSIEDAVELIADLKDKGYTSNQIKYLELEDGRHDVKTWAMAFPDFLKWGWGTK